MKKAKIRFIEGGTGTSEDRRFSIQQKRWYGWRQLGYWVDLGYGSFYEYFTAKTKEELLEKILDKYYKTSKKFITIMEYPMIKWY